MPQARGVTIRDIATRARVSISTVSRVLTGNAPVAEEKREAVLRAIEELNYQPNVFAQSLVSGESRTVGVLTQNISSRFYNLVLQGIMDGLRDSDYSPLFADGDWQGDLERRALTMLLARRVDALIVVGGVSPESYLRQLASGLPLVVIGRDLASLPGQCVTFDDFGGGYGATAYLIAQGHRRIAHITGLLSHEDARRRLEGYLKALDDAGIAADEELVIEGDFMEQSGVEAVERLLRRGRQVTAIFAANDPMAFGASLALMRRGLRVPDDISIIGFDDQSPSAYLFPPLTTVRQPAVEMGAVAARAILDAVAGVSISVPSFPAELVIRESVAPPLP